MVQALVGTGKKLACLATLTAVFVLGSLAQQDPPSRVARLNYINGNVSMQPAGVNDWAPAEINHPFTVGDYLYTDAGARTELHLDVAVIHLGPQTSFGFLNLDDQTIQIKLSEGDMSFRLHDFGPDQVFEVDTPNAAVQLLRDGIYRFRVDPNGAMSFVVTREGQAEITGGGQAFTINPGNSVLVSGADQPAFDVEKAPAPDDFDVWCAERDAREAHLTSARFLPPTVVGYEDLDQYGGWQKEGEYGPVWYPRQVAADWAPYHQGHWTWIEPWGWTWVDAAPWGFAPFHYGRWAYIGNRWGWCPGPIAVVGHRGPVIRPYYAPALVAWFGGAHWGASVSNGPSLGWVPLGFGEVFTPSYACSRPYFNNVNVHNTRVVKNINISNVYNTVYFNKTFYNRQFVNVHAPNAIFAMRQSAFASGQPVHRDGFAVREADLRQAGGGSAVISPGVAPTRQALLTNTGTSAVRPQSQIINRQVVAMHTPAAAPAAFAVRQQYLQTHADGVHNSAAMHQAVAASAPTAQAIRPALPVQPVPAQPGQHFGNPMVFPEQNHGALQRSVPAIQPRNPSGKQSVQPQPFQPTVYPVPPQQTRGVPPDPRGPSRSEFNGNASSNARLPAQPNQPRPLAERPQPEFQQNRQAEHITSQPALQPSHERSAEHAAPAHTEAPHAQPSAPPPARNEHQPEHNNGEHNHENHGDKKSK